MDLAENESVEFLDGNLTVVQNTELYRFTSDSVLLAKFVKGKSHEMVADFCAGSGVVGLEFLALNPLTEGVTFFELQPCLASLAEKSVQRNNLKNCAVVCAPLQELGGEYREAFSLILCNPPYERGGFDNKDERKAICRKELKLTLPELVAAAARCLKFGGRFALVHRADRLAELFYCLKQKNLEPKRLQLVSGTAEGKPYLVLVEACKGGKEGLEVLPTLVNGKG